MSFLKFAATFLVIAALLSPAVQASGFENTGLGTQARGMAGAFRAVADDWTAAYYNPAGYAWIADNQLGGNAALIHLRNELNPDFRLGDVYETGIFNDQINYNRHEVYFNPAGGFIARLPIMGEIVVGLSAYQPFDYNICWELYDIPIAYNDSLYLPNDQFMNNLDVVAFQLTLARELTEDKLSVGLGLQLLRADLVFNDVIFRDNPWEEDSPLNVRPYDKITEWSNNDGYGWGFGLTAGLMLKATEKLNVGITASLPSDITISGTSRLEYYMPLIPSLLTPGSTDGEDVIPGTPQYLFASGTKIVDTADFEAKLKLPTSLGLGLAYNVNEKLTVALDAKYTMWSEYDGLTFVYTDHRGLTGAADSADITREFFAVDSATNPVEWQDVLGASLGIRYDLSEKVTFLAGGAMEQSPAREATEFTPQFVDTGDKMTLAGGVVYHHGQWDFGLAGSYTGYPDLTVPELVDTDEDGNFDSFAGDYSASTYETVLSFKYRF